MANKDQFYSFEEALKELRLKEEELKRLVSEGEIRAFREGDTMRLRRADVENLRQELSGGEVVDLGDVREELVFEDDVELAGGAGMATQEITMASDEVSEVETVIDDAPPETKYEEFEVVKEEESAPRVTRREVEVVEEYEGGGMRTLLLLTSVVLILGVPLTLAFSTGKIGAVAHSIAGIFGGK